MEAWKSNGGRRIKGFAKPKAASYSQVRPAPSIQLVCASTIKDCVALHLSRLLCSAKNVKAQEGGLHMSQCPLSVYHFSYSQLRHCIFTRSPTPFFVTITIKGMKNLENISVGAVGAVGSRLFVGDDRIPILPTTDGRRMQFVQKFNLTIARFKDSLSAILRRVLKASDCWIQ